MVETSSSNDTPDAESKDSPKIINLCGKTCPETFVEAKLALEKMDHGERLNVIVDDSRSVKRVPRNMENHGQLHVETNKQNGTWQLVFERQQERDRERWVMLD